LVDFVKRPEVLTLRRRMWCSKASMMRLTITTPGMFERLTAVPGQMSASSALPTTITILPSGLLLGLTLLEAWSNVG
jgi:hypothetical protein